MIAESGRPPQAAPAVTRPIEAILFDMGGTLRRNLKRAESARVEVVRRLLDRLGSADPAPEFTRLLETREAAYEAWAHQNLTELGEVDLWTRWMLPDWPAEKIGPLAMDLNIIWREAIATRHVFPETRETILGLHRRGYRLALVSNTTSSVDSPGTLEREGIAACFEAVVLSCVVGKRKPGPDILLEAARRLGLRPGRCAYVGDRPEWDVVAARLADFSLTIILRNPLRPLPPSLPPSQTPDFFIDSLTELLDLFPPRNGKRA